MFHQRRILSIFQWLICVKGFPIYHSSFFKRWSLTVNRCLKELDEYRPWNGKHVICGSPKIYFQNLNESRKMIHVSFAIIYNLSLLLLIMVRLFCLQFFFYNLFYNIAYIERYTLHRDCIIPNKIRVMDYTFVVQHSRS